PADAHAVALLARAARLAPGEAIPRDLLLATLRLPEEDRSARREAVRGLNRLLALGLLERLEAGALRIHRLLSAFARQAAPDDGALAAVEAAVIDAAYAANASGAPAQMAPLLPHLRFLAEAARARNDEWAATLFNEYGIYLQMVGDYAAARPLYERALAIRDQALGPAHPDTAASLNNLAALLADRGSTPRRVRCSNARWRSMSRRWDWRTPTPPRA
ncbi:MAG: tetratricopeptide repeat protein, partial [Roseiflexus sp.]|nr:tetratricopeptide repeat protein [Roseiflexus sp.]